ncbi:MAG: hypothetical protein R3Y58_00115 [Eubacteriales bacterium]
MEDVFEQLVDIIAGLNLEGLELEDVTNKSKLVGDIGLTSLSMIMVAYEIETFYEIRFENDVLERMITVGDTVELIQSYKEKAV